MNKKEVKYPKKYIKSMKKQKHRKIRYAKLEKVIIEKEYNTAEREL